MIIVGGAKGFSVTSKFSLVNHSEESTVVFEETEKIKASAGNGSNFLNINMHTINIVIVFLDCVRLYLAICSGLDNSLGKSNRIPGMVESRHTGNSCKLTPV